MYNLKTFHENIKKLRNLKKLTQDELARKSGLKFTTIAKIEGGFNINPTLETLLALARELSNGSIDKLIAINRKN